MSIGSKAVGSSEIPIFLLSDPLTASQLASVLAIADSLNLAGTFAVMAGAAPLLLNAGGTYDRQRSTVGATGVAAANTEGSKTTYSVGVVAFTPVATPTDFWQVIGSATKTVRVLRITISGIATSATSVDIQLIKRSTASTGGTPTSLTVAPHDSNDAAVTAAVKTFAANPSPLGTSVGVVRAQKLNLGATGAAGVITWDFTTRNGKGIVLRGVAEQLAMNWNGAAVPAGTLLAIDVELSEE
jgi:hypothetical protein